MSDLLTDPPAPDCPYCDGRGVVGGCWECSLVQAVGLQPEHQHTYSFCECMNERTDGVNERTDGDNPPSVRDYRVTVNERTEGVNERTDGDNPPSVRDYRVTDDE